MQVGWHVNCELWVNLPSDMTLVLEEAVRSRRAQPILFERYTQHQHTALLVPTQTNRYTGMVRRMQRVVLRSMNI